MSERPELIAIDHDDYHAEHVGRLPDGRQFFLTTPFERSEQPHDADLDKPVKDIAWPRRFRRNVTT